MAEPKPILALDLSNSGISFWHRDGAGWESLGQIALDAPDMATRIKEMRRKAGISHNNPVKTAVRIPPSEVMTSRLKLGVFEGDAAVSHARKLIADLTPYALSEVIYDLDAKGVGNMAPVAIAARETLLEAESFASQYGFEAVYFTTYVEPREFPREPRFYLKAPRKPFLPLFSRIAAAAAIGLTAGYFGYINFVAPGLQAPTPVAVLELPVVDKPQPAPEPEVVAIAEPEPTPEPEPELPPEFSAPQTATLIAPTTTEYPQLVISDIGRSSLAHLARLARPRQQQGTALPHFEATTTSHKSDALALAEAHRDLPDIAIDDANLETQQTDMALATLAQNVADTTLQVAAFTPPDTAYGQMISSLLTEPITGYSTLPLDAREPADPPPPPPAPIIAEPGTLTPTPEGTLGPENILIFSGRPANLPRLRPVIAPPSNPLARFRPRPRPAGLVPLDLLATFQGPRNPVQPQSPDLTADTPNAPKPQLLNETPSQFAALIAPSLAGVAPAVGGPVLSILALADPALAGIKPRARPAGLVPLDLLAAFQGPENPSQPQSPDLTVEAPNAPLQQISNEPPTSLTTLNLPGPAGAPPAVGGPVLSILALTDPALAGIKPRARPAGLVPTPPAEPEIPTRTEIPSLLALADPTLAGIKPRTRPATLDVPTQVPPPEDQQPSILALADPALANKKTRKRPNNLEVIAPAQPQIQTVYADPALASFRAKKRPPSLKIIATVPEEPAAPPTETTLDSATRFAVAISQKPKARPSNLAVIAAITTDGDTRTTARTPKTAEGSSRPSSNPTGVTVAKAATEKSRFNKRKMSLVGVFGAPSARRALVRMPSGRYVKVKTGDRLSGWKVSAIGESSLRIRKGSKNQTLRMP